MNIVQSLKACLGKYFVFSQRASRSEYWWFYLAYVVVTLLANLVSVYLPPLVALILLCPMFAVTVRRLHDTGRSAWILLVGLIPIVGAIYLLYVIVQGSTSEANQWGANPLSVQ